MKTPMYTLKTLSLLLVLGLSVVSTGCSTSDETTEEVTEETTEVTEETTEETETTSTPPTLTAFTGSIAENGVAGASVGTITVDVGDSAITAITLSGTGNENFAVDTAGNITLSSSVALDYETTTSYTLSAIATSDAGDSASVAVAVNITNIVDAPTLIAFTGSIAENEISGFSVGTITANGEDSAITAITLSGTGNENFAVDTAGNITLSSSAALDYETTMSYTLSAIATTSVGGSNSVDVTISIIDYFSPLEVAKMTASDGDLYDEFGGEVAISGDYIVVGAPYNDDNGPNSGAAYVFKISTDGNVIQKAKLAADGGAEDDGFGWSVAILGDYIVVGAPDDDENASNSGAAYLFKINTDDDTVSEAAKIKAGDGAEDDYLGVAVAISGDYIVVGASEDDGDASDSGSAYLFKINTDDDTVSETTKLTASDGAASDYFGGAVAISGDYIVVGASEDDDNASDSGSVYLFKINTDDDTVSETAKLTADDGADYDYFGGAVAILGDYIVVGAYWADGVNDSSGSAYVFKIDSDESVSKITKLTADDGAENDYFGFSVAISGDYIVVGAYYDDDNGNDSGSAYLFKINTDDDTISQTTKLTASDGAASDYFGRSVGISGDYIVSGAFGDDDKGNTSGSAYTIALEPQDRPYWKNYVAEIEMEELPGNIYTVLTNSINTGDIIVSLSGVDAGNFTFSYDVIGAAAALRYGSPLDSDSDNVYEITVSLEDAEGQTYSYDTSIVILNPNP